MNFRNVFLPACAALAALAAFSLHALQDVPDAPILAPGTVLERSLAGGEAHSYRVTLAAGEYAGLTVEQRGIDVIVQVLDNSGKVAAEFDSEIRPNGTEAVALVADAPENCQLRIRPKYPKAPAGRYEVRVLEIRRATEQDRSAFAARKLTVESQQRIDAGKYDEAIELASRAVQAREQASGPEDAFLAVLLGRLGLLQRRKSDYAKAEQSFGRALAISEKALGRSDPQTAQLMRGLGLLYCYTGDYAKADPLLTEQLSIIESALGGEHPATAGALSDLSILYQQRGDLQRALAIRRRALDIAEKTLNPDDYLLMAVTANLGDLYSLAGDNEHAEPLLERALAMAERIYGPDHPYVSTALQNLGIIARETKRYPRALEFLSRALAIRQKAVGLRHPDIATLLINIGNLHHAQHEFSQALEFHERAMEILTATVGPYHRLTLQALADLCREYAALGPLSRATECHLRFADALEKDTGLHLSIGSEREKLVYLNFMSAYVDRIVSFHAQQAPDDRASRELAAFVLLRHKGRVLDATSGSLAALRGRLNEEDRQLLDQLSETNSKLADLALGGPGKAPADEYRKQVAELEERRERLESAISRRSAEFRAQTQPVTLAAIRAAIPPDAALIELAQYRPFDPKGENEDEEFGEARYIAYVLRREGEVQWRDLGSAAAIDGAAARFRLALRDARRQDVKALARAVDGRILQPLRPLLGDATRLLISPDGALNLIPLEALVDEQGHYQVERYAIHYLTTGRDLLRLQVSRASHKGPVVFADPLFGEPAASPAATSSQPKLISLAARRSITTGQDMSSVYFAPLAGTAQEANSIRELFPDAEILTGAHATKAALQQVDAPRILHIATHGFFLDDSSTAAPPRTRAIQTKVKIENPLLRSGLALAGANLSHGQGDGGILTALEASNLNLWGTAVVTLSACETGVGEVRIGEGVYGLRRAFLLAGAETLVMSLWPISDRATRETMTVYYTGLKNGLGRGQALRQAQLAMLKSKDRRHPFYWASFIQSGEWKNLDGK